MREYSINTSSPRKRGTHPPRPLVGQNGRHLSQPQKPVVIWVPAFAGTTFSELYSTRRPRESGGPIPRGLSFGRDGRHLSQPQKPVVIGPCVRRDDEPPT